MAKSMQSWGIPTELSLEQFRQFVLPHLTVGRRGPAPKLSLHALFNYILELLYLGCQWKELPPAAPPGRPERAAPADKSRRIRPKTQYQSATEFNLAAAAAHDCASRGSSMADKPWPVDDAQPAGDSRLAEHWQR
jgi:hypothetical protein